MGNPESKNGWYKAIYYFYDYDDIDPLTDQSFIEQPN